MNGTTITSVNGERLQRMRTAAGFSRTELAQMAGVSASMLTRLESEQLDVDAGVVQGLARSLRCTEKMLTRPVPDVLFTRPWLRAYADAPKKVVDQQIADTLIAVEAFRTLGLRQVRDSLPVFRGDVNDEDAIDDFALTVREAASIEPDVPVPNVTRAAERLGCVVLPLDSELGKHLGMSMYVDGVPVIRVARPAGPDGVPGDRQRFTLAHELGHLTLHASRAAPEGTEEAKAIEKQAHRFAGAFLLPGDAFLAHLDELGGRVTLATLAKMKGRWGVAIKAMVIRLQQLHRIDSDQARSLYKQISARGMNKKEPGEVATERAIWFATSSRERLGEGFEQVAVEKSELGAAYIGSWLTWDGGGQPAPVVDLAARRRVTSRA